MSVREAFTAAKDAGRAALVGSLPSGAPWSTAAAT
jgi:hypothetical protein